VYVRATTHAVLQICILTTAGDGDIEQVVGRKSELKNGEYVANRIRELFFSLRVRMKECSIDGQQILLVRDNERVFAIGSKCTHIGANLKDGVSATWVGLAELLSPPRVQINRLWQMVTFGVRYMARASIYTPVTLRNTHAQMLYRASIFEWAVTAMS
jgi:hypothetical protein